MTEIIERNKYNTSRIYKICSNLSDKIYVGSTTQSLAQRLSEHIRDYKIYLKDNTQKFMMSYEIIKLNDAYISLIEECNFNNRQQLHKREGEVMKEYNNIIVNKLIAGRTIKQWGIDNKEELIKYRLDNKESIAEKVKQYYETNKQSILTQQKQHYETNKQSVLEQKKQYYEINKQSILEQRKQTFLCNCGKTLTICHKFKHEQTTKHLQLINKLYIDELTYYM